MPKSEYPTTLGPCNPSQFAEPAGILLRRVIEILRTYEMHEPECALVVASIRKRELRNQELGCRELSPDPYAIAIGANSIGQPCKPLTTEEITELYSAQPDCNCWIGSPDHYLPPR